MRFLRHPARLPILLAVAATVAAPATASAGTRLDPPQLLPGDAAAASAGASITTWIVGHHPGAEAARLGTRFGGSEILPGVYGVERSKARPLAAAAKAAGLLVYSEPDRPIHEAAAIPLDPLSIAKGNNWRGYVVRDATVPPPVTPQSPLLAVLDSRVDQTHPEFAGNPNVITEGPLVIPDLHGTAVTAVAAAPTNGVGISGVWPGSRVANLSDPLACGDAGRLIRRAITLGAATINMSYVSTRLCFVEYQAIQLATRRGTISVASAGNDFKEGNPLEFPASLPHVVTVAATDPSDDPVGFSNANAAVDLSAPGVGIITAVPLKFDTDDSAKDGYAKLAGTSFSAPMVSAAMGWIRQARPELSPGQVRDTVRLSARDVGRSGWDQSTGYGVLDIDSALTFKAPREDPGEPNDDIIWVDGRAFGKPNAPVYDGGKRIAFQATLDQFEDPEDVYRVVVPPHTRVKLSLKPVFGDADLQIYARSAKVASGAKGLITKSKRTGTSRDTVLVRNTGRSNKVVYAAALIDTSVRDLNSRYTFSAARG
jgi:hypothetical protein